MFKKMFNIIRKIRNFFKCNSSTDTRIICLCGSTKFKDAFESAIREESLKGNIVLSVAQFSHADGLQLTSDEKIVFDIVHLAKIRLADEILVINVNNYIEESTYKEIEYAKQCKKVIKYRY